MKKSLNFVSFALLLVLCCALPAFGASVADKEQAALQAAQEFLALIDTANYAKSWDVTAMFFKQNISKEAWIREIETLRPIFMPVKERKVRFTRYAKSFPGIPAGEYVVIQFDTDFEHNPGALELVTPMLEPDGHWRVSGYYIK
jgi:Protein of unknown function (DUF4019)